MTRKNNQLTRPQVLALYQKLGEHRATIAEKHPRQIAAELMPLLGFALTESNVATALKDLGIVKPRPEPAAPVCRCVELAQCLADMYERNDLPIPPPVKALLGGKVKADQEPGLPLKFDPPVDAARQRVLRNVGIGA